LPAWEEKSVIVKETKEDNPSANTVAKLNTVVSKKKKTVKNKWQIGVTTTAGISNVTESVLSLHKARNQNYTTALSSSSAITYNYPSANYAALGLQAGLFAQLNLSARTGIQAGLNYAFYQTKITTGKPLDPATLAGNLNGFSNVRSGNAVFGNKNNYNSKLHYLELPVAFAWQINKSNRIPITWSNGLIIGQLIKADYLHYDTIARGIYYHDNTLLSKTSVALYTGIGVRLFAHSKTPLQVGPSLQWGITDLLKPSAEKKYLLYGALKMQLFLSGKKNN
jgi:hypothetical protein